MKQVEIQAQLTALESPSIRRLLRTTNRALHRRFSSAPRGADTSTIASYIDKAIAHVPLAREGHKPLIFVLPDVHHQTVHRAHYRVAKAIIQDLSVPALGLESFSGRITSDVIQERELHWRQNDEYLESLRELTDVDPSTSNKELLVFAQESAERYTHLELFQLPHELPALHVYGLEGTHYERLQAVERVQSHLRDAQRAYSTLLDAHTLLYPELDKEALRSSYERELGSYVRAVLYPLVQDDNHIPSPPQRVPLSRYESTWAKQLFMYARALKEEKRSIEAADIAIQRCREHEHESIILSYGVGHLNAITATLNDYGVAYIIVVSE